MTIPPSISPLADTDSAAMPTMVLLHAFPLDRTMWEPQIAGLAGKARILAVDLERAIQHRPAPVKAEWRRV